MHASSPHPGHRPSPGCQHDIPTLRRQRKILLSTACTILSLRQQLLHAQALISIAPRSVSVGCYPKLSVILEPSAPLGRCSLRAARATKSLGHSYSTTTHCKNFLSLASPFLLCCNASIFFSHFIFFSLLCCYRLCHWHCSWSTFRYILLLGL